MRLSHFQNKSYIPQLFTRKFSPREPKCPNGVAVRDWDGQFIFRTKHTDIKVVTTQKIAPIGAILLLCHFACQLKIFSPRPLFMILQ